MPNLKMKLQSPGINPGKGSLLSSLLSGRGQRSGGSLGIRRSNTTILTDEAIAKMPHGERREYLRNPKVQKVMNERTRIEADAEYRAFQRDKDIVTEQRAEERLALDKSKESYGRNKDLVYKSIELLNSAKTNGNMAMQKNLISSMEGYLRNLDPHMQALIAPIIQSGPFSPEAGRMRKWDEHNPMPQDFKQVDPSQNPEMYGRAWLDWQQWHEGREFFRTGKATNKRGFARISKDLAVVRGKDGATVMSTDDMKLEEFAKKMNTTVGELILNNGVKGPDRKVLRDGKEITYGFNMAMDGSTSVEIRSDTPSGMHDKATDFAAAYQQWDDIDEKEKDKVKSSPIAQARQLIEKEGMELSEYNKKYFKPKFGANLTIAPDGSTGVVYGEPEILERHHVYINNSGEVFTEFGESLGDYETAVETLRLRLEISEITKVEKEREMKARGSAAQRGRAGGAFRMIQEKERKSGGASGDF